MTLLATRSRPLFDFALATLRAHHSATIRLSHASCSDAAIYRYYCYL
jgi:hypothetical protein